MRCCGYFFPVDTLGNRLSSVRQTRGLSVRELARLSGVAPQTIADAEQERHEPSLPVLRRLAVALGVSACWLAVLDEDPDRPPNRP